MLLNLRVKKVTITHSYAHGSYMEESDGGLLEAKTTDFAGYWGGKVGVVC